MYLIPLKKYPSYTESVNLENVTLTIRVLYNELDGAYYLDFGSVHGKNYGVKLIPNTVLVSVNHVLKSGNLIYLKDSATATDAPAYDELGTTYNLYYLTNEEIEQFKARELI